MGLINGRAALHVRLCEECGICADVCPVGAIIFRLPTKEGDEVYHGYRTHQMLLPASLDRRSSIFHQPERFSLRERSSFAGPPGLRLDLSLET